MIVYGKGGHGKVVAHTLRLLGKQVTFWDDGEQPKIDADEHEMIVATGKSNVR